MTTPDNTDKKQWQLSAITEALGDLEINVEDKLAVGRGQDNDLVLGSKQVSRQHAELSVDNNELLVKDLGSSNGTLVNDQKLAPNQPTKLTADDVVTFAAFSFKVKQAPQVQSVTPVTPATEPEATEEIVTEEIVTEEIVTEERVTEVEPESKQAQPNTVAENPAVAEKPTAESKAPTQEPVNHKTAAEHAKDNADAVEKANIEDMSKAELEQKLEQELEEPISRGNPDQKQPVGNTEEYYEELAAEADPEVHKSKQAASAQMSATTELHEDVNESVDEQPKVADSEPVAKEAPVTTENLQKTKSTDSARLAEETKVSEEPKQSFNTVNEQQEHKVAHVNNSAPQPTSKQANSGKNNTFLWIALLLVGLAVILWLYSSGSLA